MNTQDEIGFYIHIPFCARKCFYCDFNSVEGQAGLIDGYVKSLVREIEFRKISDRTVTTIFMGGGTPSVLEPRHVDSILGAVWQNFTVASNAEVSMEMNPESVTAKKLAGYRKTGVNRASLGVQSLNDDELKFLQRVHTATEAREALRLVLDAGFVSVSADMMFNLPGQSVNGWLGKLSEIGNSGISHISCYELTAEPSTPLGRSVRDGTLTLQDRGDLFFDETERLLEGLGVAHYEISNFAKDGHECRHNVGYWEQRDFSGVGAGATGSVNGVRWENIKNVGAYMKAVAKTSDPTGNIETLTCEMIKDERLMMGLRLKKGIHFGAGEIDEKIEKLINNGLLVYDGSHLFATKTGFRLLDSVLASI
ncbi:Hypothetical radical SAM family enzyme in heat shock gene cluster, similarity with CPO of BS HemN-type [hydrothermal vent metagenome]|uniref:Hypothetical radical SAM family enzyme in heat shock gene cluster, similarity with CPO of BS HemN-type n=1 Tax=hydrothermal vent metagenome TaxID=652676 RepID=A0A3B1C838_9ZZZZ